MNPSTYLLILAFLLSAGPAIAADLWPEDEDGRLLVQEARLPRVEKALERALHNRISIRAIRGHVEQRDVDARVRELPGNAEPHGTCADYGGAPDFVHVFTLHGRVVPEYEIPE